VEHVFSKGRILLSYVRNHLASQSICALMCLGNWSKLGYVKDKDVLAVAALPDIEEDKEELPDRWNAI